MKSQMRCKIPVCSEGGGTPSHKEVGNMLGQMWSGVPVCVRHLNSIRDLGLNNYTFYSS